MYCLHIERDDALRIRKYAMANANFTCNRRVSSTTFPTRTGRPYARAAPFRMRYTNGTSSKGAPYDTEQSYHGVGSCRVDGKL
jgi:hypothetical protein